MRLLKFIGFILFVTLSGASLGGLIRGFEYEVWQYYVGGIVVIANLVFAISFHIEDIQ